MNATQTYLTIRDGQIKLTVPATLDADGKLVAQPPYNRGYVIDGDLAKRDGVLEQVAAAAKAGKWSDVPTKYKVGPGVSDSGLICITRDEYDAQVLARRDEERRSLIAAVPGLDILEAAYADHDRYARQFARMMDSEDNDGARPPKQPTADVDALRAQYPRAAAYLHAKAFSAASHHVKSAEGARAMERIAAGEDAAAAINDMDNNWSDWCHKHVD